MTPEHQELIRSLQNFAASTSSASALMDHVAQTLHEKVARYNWVGFYVVDPNDADVLLVGKFVGSFTPNARIPLKTGLCGAAATTGKTVVVDDVTKDPRYLAGSNLVKSEIVVPIFVKDKLAAVLDIESYFAGTFTPFEQEFVEACAKLVGKYLPKQ